MPDALDGEASAVDFDWYDDTVSDSSIGVPAHPHLHQLKGDSTVPPTKKVIPATMVSGDHQSPHRPVKRKSSRLASKPVKKAKIASCAKAVESDDEAPETASHEGEGRELSERHAQEDVEDEVDEVDDVDLEAQGYLQDLNVLSAKDQSVCTITCVLY
jgi:hypothetical protein